VGGVDGVGAATTATAVWVDEDFDALLGGCVGIGTGEEGGEEGGEGGWGRLREPESECFGGGGFGGAGGVVYGEGEVVVGGVEDVVVEDYRAWIRGGFWGKLCLLV
jgi:hypothetical protein